MSFLISSAFTNALNHTKGSASEHTENEHNVALPVILSGHHSYSYKSVNKNPNCRRNSIKLGNWYSLLAYSITGAFFIFVLCYVVKATQINIPTNAPVRTLTSINSGRLNSDSVNVSTITIPQGNIVDSKTPVIVQLTTGIVQQLPYDYILSNNESAWTATPVQIFYNNASTSSSYTFTFPNNGIFYIMYIAQIDWKIHATIQVQVGPTTQITSTIKNNSSPIGTYSFFLTTSPADRGAGDYIFSNSQPVLTSSPQQSFQNNGKIAASYSFTFSKPGTYYVMYVSAKKSTVAYILGPLTVVSSVTSMVTSSVPSKTTTVTPTPAVVNVSTISASNLAPGNYIDTGVPVNVQLVTATSQRINNDYIFSNTESAWTANPLQRFDNGAQAKASYNFTFPNNGTFYIMYVSPIDWGIHATLEINVGPTTQISTTSGSLYLPVGTSNFLLTTSPSDRGIGDYIFSHTQPVLTSQPLQKFQNYGKISAIFTLQFSTPGTYYVMYVSPKDGKIHFTLTVKVVTGTVPTRNKLTPMQIGTISYWPPTSANFDQLQPGSIAVLNPNNGIFQNSTSFEILNNIAAYQDAVRRTTARGVKIIGYIPTGNGNHTAGCYIAATCQGWDRINAQLQAYAKYFPTLSGIWFDEAAFPSGLDTYSNIVTEYASLRKQFNSIFGASIASTSPLLVFNPGSPYIYYPQAAKPGETVIIFENSQAAFLSQQDLLIQAQTAAAANQVKTWAVINNCPNSVTALNNVLTTANNLNVDFVYVTSIGADWRNGDNTYGSLPGFWANETAYVAQLAQ